jgi:hypothetical protein
MRPILVALLFCVLLSVVAGPTVSQSVNYPEAVKAIQEDARVKAAFDHIDKDRDAILREWIAITEIRNVRATSKACCANTISTSVTTPPAI